MGRRGGAREGGSLSIRDVKVAIVDCTGHDQKVDRRSLGAIAVRYMVGLSHVGDARSVLTCDRRICFDASQCNAFWELYRRQQRLRADASLSQADRAAGQEERDHD